MNHLADTNDNAGIYSDEHAFNCDTETFDKRKIKVSCPHCGNASSPLCSKKTTVLQSWWKWVFDSHKEPHTEYASTCSKCKKRYRFTVFTPQ